MALKGELRVNWNLPSLFSSGSILLSYRLILIDLDDSFNNRQDTIDRASATA